MSEKEITDTSPQTNSKKNKLLKTFMELVDLRLIEQNFANRSDAADSERLRDAAFLRTLWANCIMAARLLECMSDFKLLEHASRPVFKFFFKFWASMGLQLSMFLSSVRLDESDPHAQAKAAAVENMLLTIDQFAGLFQAYMKRVEGFTVQGKPLFITLFALLENVERMLHVEVRCLMKSALNSIFDPSRDAHVNGLLAGIKRKCLSILKKFLEFYNTCGNEYLRRLDKENSVTHLTQTIQLVFSRVLRNIMDSLSGLMSSPDMGVGWVQADAARQSLVIDCFSVLQMACEHSDMILQFTPSKLHIFVGLVLPHCLAFDPERQMLRDNPSDFVNLAFQLMEYEHAEMTVKSAVLNLLETLCDKMDGFLTLVVSLSLRGLCLLLRQDFGINIRCDEAEVGQLVNSRLWTHTPAELRVDALLLVLSRVSYSVKERPDLVGSCEHFIKGAMEYAGQTDQSLLIVCRYAVMINLYIDICFMQTPLDRLVLVKWVISLFDREDEVVVNVAHEVVESVLKLDVIKPFPDELALYLISKLFVKIQRAPTSSVMSMTELTFKQFKLLYLNNPKVFSDAVESLVDSVLALVRKSNLQMFLINRCWNILRLVSEDLDFYRKYSAFIEQQISKTFPLIQEIKGPDNCDEDILDCVISWTRKSYTISAECLRFLQMVDFLQKKQDNKLNRLYVLLNNLFTCEEGVLQAADVQRILAMAIRAMSADYQTKFNEGWAIAEGALLVQLVLIRFTEHIDVATLEKILTEVFTLYLQRHQFVVDMYKYDEKHLTVQPDLYYQGDSARVFFEKVFGVFLVAMMLLPQATVRVYREFIRRHEEKRGLLELDYLLNLICQGLDEFCTAHDKTILICGLSGICRFFAEEYHKDKVEQSLFFAQATANVLVLVMKGFELQKKLRLNESRSEKLKIEKFKTIELYNVIRKQLGLKPKGIFVDSKSRDKQTFTGEVLTSKFMNSNMSIRTQHKQIMMNEISSKIDKIDELDFCRDAIKSLKEKKGLYEQVMQGLDKVAAGYGGQVLLNYYYVHGKFSRLPRKIAKLRTRPKKK